MSEKLLKKQFRVVKNAKSTGEKCPGCGGDIFEFDSLW